MNLARLNSISLTIVAIWLGLAGSAQAQNLRQAGEGDATYQDASLALNTPPAGRPELLPAASFATARDFDSELIRKYLDALRIENAARQVVDVEVLVEARLPKLNRQATLRALRTISPTGAVTYTALDSRGDNMVRREIIARYLALESQEHDAGEIAITPLNYRFRLKGMIEEHARQIYVFQLAPKRKKVGLFKGELWVDGQTGLPVHEAGRFVKSPSVFIKRIEFTRDYASAGDAGVSIHVQSTVESRIAGRVELDIRFIDIAAAREAKPEAQHVE